MDIWKDLEGLEIDLPDGIGPSDMEDSPEEATGFLWEVTTKIYIWTDMDNHKYQLTSTQTMTPLGDSITLADAQKRMKRNRRKGA
jgi:hypothetical protein